MTDREPVTIVSKGLTNAEIYGEYCEALIRFATILVGADAAQDVVSSAFLRSLEGQSWNRVENHRSYLYQAVSNEARNLRRSESRRRNREIRTSIPVVIQLPEFHPEVRRAVEKLSMRQRAVVYLTYWEDMTDAAIAAHLGISAGSVRKHLARARKHLRRVLHE